LQHVLFAQQPGLHAFSLATFERIHDRAESGVATIGSVIATITDMTVLPSTALALWHNRGSASISERPLNMELLLFPLLVKATAVRSSFFCVFSFAFFDAFCKEEDLILLPGGNYEN
jgi:hypothetical protein